MGAEPEPGWPHLDDVQPGRILRPQDHALGDQEHGDAEELGRARGRTGGGGEEREAGPAEVEGEAGVDGAQAARKRRSMTDKVTIAALQQMKRDGKKSVGVVAWDYQIALIADRAGGCHRGDDGPTMGRIADDDADPVGTLRPRAAGRGRGRSRAGSRPGRRPAAAARRRRGAQGG